MKSMILTLEGIAERTGLPLRGLRYICDREIVEIAIRAFSRRTHSLRRGLSRRFYLYDAFAICLAEMLRQAGLDGPRAGLALRRLAGWICPPEMRVSNYDRLAPLYETASQLIIEVADAAFLRAEVSAEVEDEKIQAMALPAHGLPWTLIQTGQHIPAFVPLVLARLDVALLRQRLEGGT